MKEYEKIKNEHRLRPTTQDLLHLMYEFGRLHKINDVITVHSVDDQFQKLETDTCGIFQLYFYFNLFMLFEDSSVLKDAKLSKRTIEKLLNEIFSLDRDRNGLKNSRKRRTSKDNSDINLHLPTNNLHLLNIVGFGQVSNRYYAIYDGLKYYIYFNY